MYLFKWVVIIHYIASVNRRLSQGQTNLKKSLSDSISPWPSVPVVICYGRWDHGQWTDFFIIFIWQTSIESKWHRILYSGLFVIFVHIFFRHKLEWQVSGSSEYHKRFRSPQYLSYWALSHLNKTSSKCPCDKGAFTSLDVYFLTLKTSTI